MSSAARGKLTGTVKFYLDDKKYGFLVPDDGGNDLFFHMSNIAGKKRFGLNPDDRVSYDVGSGPNGAQAINVSVIETKSDTVRLYNVDDDRVYARGYSALMSRQPLSSQECAAILAKLPKPNLSGVGKKYIPAPDKKNHRRSYKPMTDKDLDVAYKKTMDSLDTNTSNLYERWFS